MLAHMKGHEGNLLARTQIQSLRARQLLATLCVILSLALFAQGGTDSASGFCLRTLSGSRPTTIMGMFWIQFSYPVL
jgi:hypothetical protein